MRIDEASIRSIVEEIVNSIDIEEEKPKQASDGTVIHEMGAFQKGVFDSTEVCVQAARQAQKELVDLGLAARKKMIEFIRQAVLSRLEMLSRLAVEETGFGRVEDKIQKNKLAATMTPGVEDVQPTSFTDDHGLTLMERAPYGIIGAITPSTNPTETIVNNAISMIAGGNAVVFCPHPQAKNVSCLTVSLINEAIVQAGGPENVVTTLREPTIETAQAVMADPNIGLLTVTGGGGVVKAAMQSGKKVIAAGPGNPPCVVDETANIEKAGKDIVAGASLDNNIICICEKEVLAVDSITDQLKTEMKKHGAYELTKEQIDALTPIIISDPGREGHEGAPNKAFVGKNASVIAKEIGLDLPDSVRILLCEVDRHHPLVWTEQLMPVIPIVRMPSADDAIDLAIRCEHGFRHTASMFSRNIDRLSKMAKEANCSLFVKNGATVNGMAYGGAGFTSFTIASPTGEGFTRATTFTRERRCALIGSFRIV